jgi:hypothetical protein
MASFVVQKPFIAFGEMRQRGEILELTISHRTQTLVDNRLLLPADPEVAAAAKSLTNIVIDANAAPKVSDKRGPGRPKSS